MGGLGAGMTLLGTVSWVLSVGPALPSETEGSNRAETKILAM